MANGGDSSSVTSSQFQQLMAAISGLKEDTEAAIDQKMAKLKAGAGGGAWRGE